MRVLVTGSRDWESRVVVCDALAATVAEAGDVLTVVHGDCPSGADRMARGWCEAMGPVLRSQGINFYEERHPADWSRYGKQAGFKRNAEMVTLGVDVCLAFLRVCTMPKCRIPDPHGSHGAAHCVGRARRRGIEVREFREGW